MTPGPFELAPFMTVFVIVAGFQLGWAPYVSDYSRYLPATVGVRKTFWWTYAPSVISSVWVFVLGAVVAAASPGSDPIEAFISLGDRLFPGFGVIGLSVLFLGVLSIMVINQYGGSLALISIVDSFTRIRPTRFIRVVSILVLAGIVFVISQFVGIDNFNIFFSNVLIFLAYLFTPWTAINLVDYFFVRKGRYVVAEIFKPNGIYGRWGWRGIGAYIIALVAMVPFMVTAPFTGFIAAAAGAVDYSVFVGLPVAAVLYLSFCRSLDLTTEIQLSKAEGHTHH
ncbi:purine-cytosine permease family protein [Pseudarthrobacter sp. S9]|uniref:purine-cytosine permease family protein n=1 Tax=Pseudarthrobacter sp. S9 TaxID=3418421 RepID=UPI003D030751